MADYKDHLERLVFEVYGADEAKRKLEEIAKAEDKYAKSTRGVIREAKNRAKAEEDAAKQIAESQRKIREESQKTLKIAGGAIAALAALAAEAAIDLEEANGRVERSFRRAGASQADVTKTMAEADARARKLGLGLLETRNYMSQLLDATGDTKVALEDLKLAQDIAATGDTDLRGAVELLTKARKGEVEELKKLDGINKTTAESIAGIADVTERAKRATELLAKEYKGAADELRGAKNDIENIKQAGQDLLAVIGDTGSGLINATASWFGIIDKNQSLLTQFATGLRNFAGEAKEASTYLADFVAYRESIGFFGQVTPEGFAQFVSQRDTERAQAAADQITPTARSRENVGRGGRRGYGGNRGGYRDVPRQTTTKKRSGGRREPGAEFTTLEEENAFRGDFGTQEEADRLRQFEQDKADAAKRGLELRKEQAEEEKKILERLTKEREKATAAEVKLAKQAADERRKSALATADAVGSGIQTLSDSFIKGEGKKALISGAVESARAIAAYVQGNIAGGIGHTAAAAAFFKVAADAGVSGGKGSGAAGSTGASGAVASRERESVALIGERERSSDAFRRTGSYALNIYTAFPPTPEHARQLADAIENESRNR